VFVIGLTRVADTLLTGMRKLKRGSGDKSRVAVSAGRGGAGHQAAIPAVVGDGYTEPK
jgi:hypothetical protein